jgi:hypothetical protein
MRWFKTIIYVIKGLSEIKVPYFKKKYLSKMLKFIGKMQKTCISSK